MFRSVLLSAVVAGTTVLSGAGAGVVNAASPVSTHVAAPLGHGRPDPDTHGAKHKKTAKAARAARLRRALGLVLDVTAVNGNTISAVNRANTPFTVTVSTTTTILQAGSPVSVTAITPNEFIRVRGPRTSTNTIAARRIVIVTPTVAGEVASINGTTLTLTGFYGKSYTVATTPTTTYVYAHQPKKTATFSSIATGDRVIAQGPVSADKLTVTALRVVIQRDR